MFQVTNLRKERETLITKSGEPTDSDMQRLRALQRENEQLHLKIKSIELELDEIRAQREQIGLQSDSTTRLQNKQIAEQNAVVKALEVFVSENFINNKILAY